MRALGHSGGGKGLRLTKPGTELDPSHMFSSEMLTITPEVLVVSVRLSSMHSWFQLVRDSIRSLTRSVWLQRVGSALSRNGEKY